MNFIMGVIVGIVLCTVGARGLADMIDRTVHQTQTVVRESTL